MTLSAQQAAGCIWEQLLLEIEDHIISLLDDNEVAGSVRLVCKAAASRFRGRTTLRLSQRVPPHALLDRWGSPGAMRGLTRKQREQILRAAAAGGSLACLQALVPLAGWTLTCGVLEAAAAAGHLDVCRWLQQQECPRYQWMIEEAAGRSGSLAMCEWAITALAGRLQEVVLGAARAGHVDLVDQLLALYGRSVSIIYVLGAVAEGCDLAALQRLHAAWMGSETPPSGLVRHALLRSAAASPTPDWRAKVEWVDGAGAPAEARTDAMRAAASQPDGLDRLDWMAARGWAPGRGLYLDAAAAQGDEAQAAALAAIATREELAEWTYGEAFSRLAGKGPLQLLQLLHSRGVQMNSALSAAAAGGHLHVLAWAAEVEGLGAEALSREDVLEAAIRSGSVPLLAWLRERGCSWPDDEWALHVAVAAGSVPVLEWLVAQGCRTEKYDKLLRGPRDDTIIASSLRQLKEAITGEA